MGMFLLLAMLAHPWRATYVVKGIHLVGEDVIAFRHESHEAVPYSRVPFGGTSSARSF